MVCPPRPPCLMMSNINDCMLLWWKLSTNNNLTGPLLIGKDFSGYTWAEKNPTLFN